jgi:hypothetical protein
MANELIIKGTGEVEPKVSREEALAEMSPTDAVLIKMEIGAQIDCIFDQIEHISNANSPLVHGKFEDGTPFKMWCDGWLTNLFDRMPRIFGQLVRLRRLGDRDYGKGVGHSYAVMDLKKLRALVAKDAPAPKPADA